MQTIQQQRASYALKQIQAALADDRLDHQEFKRHARGLPAMIHTNGLGQAAAFALSKAKGDVATDHDAWHRLYRLLGDWLHQVGPYTQHHDLLEAITHGDMHSYRLAQAEALAMLDWLKKFATAYIPSERSGKNPNAPENRP
jgi:CRISPR-associated protein Cmr5